MNERWENAPSSHGDQEVIKRSQQTVIRWAPRDHQAVIKRASAGRHLAVLVKIAKRVARG